MMVKCIKKEDAVEAVWRILNGMGYSQKHNDRLVEEVDAVLDEYPAADVRPVVRGKWVKPTRVPDSMLDECSVCGFDTGAYTFNFYPNCGADMREES